jgi:hypothetical protein
MPNQPTIIIILLFISIFSMFLFPNTIYFSLNLLLVVFTTLSFLFYSNIVTSLTVLMLLIVYVGAIIILIGYVCAVCPNVNFSVTPGSYPLIFFLTPLIFFLTPACLSTPSSYFSSFNFFYSTLGLPIFLLVVFMLFLILLIVTSYYVSPKGPFRSVT